MTQIGLTNPRKRMFAKEYDNGRNNKDYSTKKALYVRQKCANVFFEKACYYLIISKF